MRFFIQAEDGIRDGHVTGVQTCALPISLSSGNFRILPGVAQSPDESGPPAGTQGLRGFRARQRRSEERRVGKGVDVGGSRMMTKKVVTMKYSRSGVTEYNMLVEDIVHII